MVTWRVAVFLQQMCESASTMRVWKWHRDWLKTTTKEWKTKQKQLPRRFPQVLSTLFTLSFPHVVAHLATGFPVPMDDFCHSSQDREERGLAITFASLLTSALLGRWTTMRVKAKGWAPQQARACGLFFNHTHWFTRTHAHWRRTGATTAHFVFYARPGAILSTTQVGIRVDSCQKKRIKKKEKRKKRKKKK